MLREHPWHLRRACVEHEQWFQNILSFHGLTRDLLKHLSEKQIGSESHLLKRVMTPQVEEGYHALEKLTQAQVSRPLADLLEDAYPEPFLERLDVMAWVTQAWSVGHLFEKTEKSEWDALRNSIDLAAWKLGMTYAKTHYPDPSDRTRTDLREVFWAIKSTPFTGAPGKTYFLVKRSLRTELSLELLNCPHQSLMQEVRHWADSLCSFHIQWMKGFCYHFNPAILAEHAPKNVAQARPRCHFNWQLINRL